MCVCSVHKSEPRPSGDVCDGFVFLQTGPLSRWVVHFEDRVHQHGGAAGAVGFGQNLGVLAQLDLDDVALLWTRVLCRTQKKTKPVSFKLHEPLKLQLYYNFYTVLFRVRRKKLTGKKISAMKTRCKKNKVRRRNVLTGRSALLYFILPLKGHLLKNSTRQLLNLIKPPKQT